MQQLTEHSKQLVNRAMEISASMLVRPKSWFLLAANHGELYAYETRDPQECIIAVTKKYPEIKFLNIQPFSNVKDCQELKAHVNRVAAWREEYKVELQDQIKLQS